MNGVRRAGRPVHDIVPPTDPILDPSDNPPTDPINDPPLGPPLPGDLPPPPNTEPGPTIPGDPMNPLDPTAPDGAFSEFPGVTDPDPDNPLGEPPIPL